MTAPRSTLDDLIVLEAMPRYYDWKADLLRPHLGSRVLELGCGTGMLLDRLAAGREFALGFDADPACVARATARFAGRPGFEVARADACGPEWDGLARDRRIDTVVLCNALELIPGDAEVIRRAGALIPAGGRVAVFASAGPWLTGALDRAYGQRRYRRRDLEGMLTEAGLRIVESRPVNLLGALAWAWESRILGRVAPPDDAPAARDRLVRICRLADRLTGPPFGRTALVAGVKT